MKRKPLVYIADRFWPKVQRGAADECWPWLASRDRKGYGQFEVDGKPRRAHRVAYELALGPIPTGALLLHSCDNRPCCNPAHLRPGTNRDNVRDMDQRGRRRTVSHQGERHGCSKLTAVAVLEIRSALANGARGVDLARAHGVSKATISAIKVGRLWRAS